MPFSFHSHSGQFCLHGSGDLEAVIQKAIEVGFHTIGLSEHVPRFRDSDLYPEESDITIQHLKDNFTSYLKEARRLRENYGSKISILVGAETENIYPEYLEELSPILEESQVDYLVGSVHHVNGIPIDFDQACFARALACFPSYEGLFEAYFDAQFRMLTSLKPAVVGHFDLIRLFAPSYHQEFPESVWEGIRRNVDYVISYGGLFEINARGWKKKLPSAYPLKDISEYIVKMGGLFTLGDDAHAPHEVALNYHRLPAYLTLLGIHELWYIQTQLPEECETPDYSCSLGKGLRLTKISNWRDLPFWDFLLKPSESASKIEI